MRRLRRSGFAANLVLVAALAAAGCERPHRSGAAAALPAAASLARGASELALLGMAQRRPGDIDIGEAVDRALRTARGLRSDLLDVRVRHGVVTVSGFVDNVIARRRAVRLAREVAYVRAVTDHIAVRPSQSRNDQAISQYVRGAFQNDPTARGWKIGVEVSDAVVTLTGAVSTQPEKRLAGDLAAGIRGVTAIDNRIAVAGGAPRSDATLRERVGAALRWDARLAGDPFRVSVRAGRVRLVGAARSAFERAVAARDAWIRGVVAVDASAVTVDRRRARIGTATAPADADIRAAIERALRRGARTAALPPSAMAVEVTRGVVTLSGVVPSLAARRAAAQLAADTTGVRRVEARIEVRPPHPPRDATIAKAIVFALLLDPYVNRYDFDVHVRAGRAVVSGRVDCYFDKWQALSIAARARGVTAVTDRVTVDYDSPLPGRHFFAWNPVLMDYDYRPFRDLGRAPDWEVRHDLDDRLRWCPLLDPERVTVAVNSGTVTLTGRVASRRARAAATWAAYLAGARAVHNALRVEPAPPPAATAGAYPPGRR